MNGRRAVGREACTLVMTLLVRDEADIVRQNLDFHLRCGVDHVIAIDNGSVDGTREILAEYARKGAVTLIDEPGRDYAQACWVTRGALMAREQMGATWVLNADADEFWWSAHGDLKRHLHGARPELLLCQRRNMVSSWDGGDGSWLERSLYRVRSPAPQPRLRDFYSDPLPLPYLYLNLPAKALLRTEGLLEVCQGNHTGVYQSPPRTAHCDIVVYHFPVRSPEQFERKVRQGGAAYARNRDLPERAGWHWRRWWRMLQTEGLESALADTLPSAQRLQRDLRSGVLLEDRTVLEYFEGVRSRGGDLSAVLS